MIKKKSLITVLVLIAAVSLGVAVFFNNPYKHNQNLSAGNQQSEPSQSGNSGQANTAQNSPEITPGVNSGTVPTAGSSSGAPSTGSGTSNNDDSTPSNSSASSTSGSSAAPGSPTSSTQASLQAQIEQKYKARLQSVGSSYEASLNSLIAAAGSDYQAAKKADPNADTTPLANNYYAAGRALEAQCDSEMYGILDTFESELQANSLPVDAAVQARAAYEATKSSRAGQILSSKP